MFLYVKPKYQYLIDKCQKVGLKHLKIPKALIKYSSYMKDVYSSIKEYNSAKNRKIMVLFYDIIVDVISNLKT